LFHYIGTDANNQVEQDTIVSNTIMPIPLVDINFEIGRTEKIFKKIENGLQPDYAYARIDTSFIDYRTFLEEEAADFKAFNPYNLSKFFLESSYRLWEGFYQKLTGWQTEINNKTKGIQDDITILKKSIKIWELTLKSDDVVNEPQDIKTRIYTVLDQANRLLDSLQAKKRQYIILEDEIAETLTFCDNIIVQISLLQQNKQDSLFIASEKPLWNVTVGADDVTPITKKLKKFRHENAKTLRNYFQTQNLHEFWIVIILIFGLFYLLRYKYIQREFDDEQAGHKHIMRIFKGFPLLTAITLVLVFFHLLYPYYPLILNNILTLVLLINMRFILSNFIDKEDKSFVLKIIILLIINDLEIVFWYFGNLSRYYILLEVLAGIYFTASYLRPFSWKVFKAKTLLKKGTWFVALFGLTFYVFAFTSNFFGYLDLAVLFAKVAIHVPEFTILLFGIYKIVVALIKAMIAIGKSQKNSAFEIYWNNIEKRAVQLSGILAVYYWFYSLTVSFEVSRTMYDAVVDFLIKERTIGTMEITIGSILALILILAITFLITGFLKITIEHVLLKRSGLPRGVPAAISVTIRYFLIILGFMFALSAAGIELGKFSLLAGALGVGIGFGLQNIVNNFISGLILVYERPLQVGDTIEVDNLLGQVHRIGIRSSNVKTYDGAEVVVPNGNLISNQLINWTLSDNKRRIEIKVGVAYGSDPNIVLELLERVASENEEVMKSPPPWALFEEFGDSSLNFRLLFWVPYDIGIGTKSKVAIGIYNIFKENGIEIPFPQVDLHVKPDKHLPKETLDND
jgi:small-conductance mechanosensitive channel